MLGQLGFGDGLWVCYVGLAQGLAMGLWVVVVGDGWFGSTWFDFLYLWGAGRRHGVWVAGMGVAVWVAGMGVVGFVFRWVL